MPVEAKVGAESTSWPTMDQRRARRYQTRPLGPIDLVVGTDEAIGNLRLRDISARGMGLVTERRLAPEPLLTARIYNPLLNYFTKIPMRVVYNIESGHGEWMVGCAFDRDLHPEEMRGLLPAD